MAKIKSSCSKISGTKQSAKATEINQRADTVRTNPVSPFGPIDQWSSFIDPLKVIRRQ